MIPEEFVPPWKQAMGDKIDLAIAHWTLYAPLRSGLYETVKELALYESKIPGVYGFMVDAQHADGGKVDTRDSRMVTHAHNYAYKWADISIIHFTHTPYGERLKPRVFMIHGTPEACLHGEMNNPGGHSFTASLHWVDSCERTIVFTKRHQYFWKPYDKNGKIELVTRGIDLERYRPDGLTVQFKCRPAILYGEVWRPIKDPFITFYGVREYLKRNNEARFYPWGLGEHRKLWEEVIFKGNFDMLFAEYMFAGVQAYPEHYYRGGDMLISPVTTGEPSRTCVEALACGCPTISWDTDNFGDNHSLEKAHAFDPVSIADVIERLWNKIQDNPQKIRKEARAIAEKYHDMSKMAQEVVSVCRDVINKQNRR